jgi:hypothetical protein
VCTASHAIVADVALVKQTDLQKYTFKKHKCKLTQHLLEKSKLALHAYEEGHKICWNKAEVLQIEPNATYRR